MSIARSFERTRRDVVSRYAMVNDMLDRVNNSGDNLDELFALHEEIASVVGYIAVSDVHVRTMPSVMKDNVLVGGTDSLSGRMFSLTQWDRMRDLFVASLFREPDYYPVVCELYRKWLSKTLKNMRVGLFGEDEGRKILGECVLRVLKQKKRG